MAARTFTLGAYDEVTRSVQVVASTRNPVKGWESPKSPSDMGKPRLEALDSWNLERFLKNPVILWQHDSCCSAIGLASDVQETPRGLEMRINFAAAADEPKAEEAIKRIRAGLVRGVSVGFDFGARTDEQRDGKDVAVFRDNELLEVSLVTVPADQNALVEPSPPGRSLNSDATEETVRRYDFGSIGKVRRSAVGGLVAPARLTRTGVLEYRTADGKIRRELRLPEEVFHADSLATLRDVPVTDLEHHRGFIDTTNFQEASLGHATEIRQDGNFVVGDLHINEARAVVDVEAKRLVDVSCGYECKMDMTSGVHEGQPYDCIQRRIRYNHVAVLPPGRGRAGADVGIRLDSTDAVLCDGEPTKAPEEPMKIRLDGKEFEFGSEEHVKHLDAKCEAAQAAEAKAKADADAVQAKFDASEKAKKDAAAAEETAKEARKAASRKHLGLVIRAMEYVDDEEEGDNEQPKKKSDAADELLDLSERELMVRVIRADDGDFDEKDKSDGYIEARYDMSLKSLAEKKNNGVDSIAIAIEKAKRSDAREGAGENPETAARDKLVKSGVEAGRKPIGEAAAK